MRVVVDLQGMQNGSRLRGIGRYVGSLAKGLHRVATDQGIELKFLVSDLFPEFIGDVAATLSDAIAKEAIVTFAGVGPVAELEKDNHWRRHASELLYQDFIEQLKPDVLLLGSVMEGASDNSIAAFPAPAERSYKVFSVLYDLIPLLNPAEHLRSESQKQWYQRRLDLLTSSDGLLAISESARQEAIVHAKVDEDRVFNIGAAAGEYFESDERDAQLDDQRESVCQYFGISKPYVLLASAFDGRKNFEGLIRAYALLREPVRARHQLVLVCKLADHQRKDLGDLIRNCGLHEGQDVILTGYVPDEDLHALYRGCQLFVFPSFHEGFGLPALEAMWCGAPTIGSSASSVPEVIGLDEALFEPDDIAGMSRLMELGLIDPAFRDRLLEHGHSQCRKFSWTRVATRAITAMKQHHTMPRADGLQVDLVEKIASRPGLPRPRLEDLVQAAKAIHANLQRAENIWRESCDTHYFGVSMQSTLG